MRQNPIAMIEFVAFIGFVIWLFFWQHKSSRPDRTNGHGSVPPREMERLFHRNDEQPQHQAEPGETRASPPDEAGSQPPSGEVR